MPDSPQHFDALIEYSQGRLARHEAIRLLGLCDHSELLVALGDANLPMPMPPKDEIESQAATFEKLWRES